jgi:putative PEP-CTERM system histidine kinase
MVAETFAVPSVTIWLLDDGAERPVQLGGSTVFAADQQHPPGFTAQGMDALRSYLCEARRLVDFAAPPDARGQELRRLYADGLRRAQMRYALPLLANQRCLGILTCHERLAGEPFTLEDEHLLMTITAQAATNLLTLQLAQQLAHAQQMQAFQTLSACFVHDLKNLAAKLSLTLQTLPVHYDDPAFREDMLRLISGSVTKIHTMCGRLSLLTQQLELHCVETDLNDLVRATLADLQSTLDVPLVLDLQPVPCLTVDPEQMEKVLTNLVLNAHEAIGAHGTIHVGTEQRHGWVELSVRDNGCGMSREFMEHSLFQPFRTTKRHGFGIGLFHSKMIVEAHQGKIEVESAAGQGSTFRVLLRCETPPAAWQPEAEYASQTAHCGR